MRILVLRFPDPIERAKAVAGPDRASGAAAIAAGGRLRLQPERQYPDGRQHQLGSDWRPKHPRVESVLSEDRTAARCARSADLSYVQQQHSAGRRGDAQPHSDAGDLAEWHAVDPAHARIRPDGRLEDAPGSCEPAGQLADEPAHVGVRRPALPVSEPRRTLHSPATNQASSRCSPGCSIDYRLPCTKTSMACPASRSS